MVCYADNVFGGLSGRRMEQHRDASASQIENLSILLVDQRKAMEASSQETNRQLAAITEALKAR
jgi:hypothetical protein